MTRQIAALPSILLACLAGLALAQESGAIPFPEGYRNWYMDHSTIPLPGHTPEDEIGIQHMYANPAALKGLETGKFDDGSIFVVDRFASVPSAATTAAQTAFCPCYLLPSTIRARLRSLH